MEWCPSLASVLTLALLRAARPAATSLSNVCRSTISYTKPSALANACACTVPPIASASFSAQSKTVSGAQSGRNRRQTQRGGPRRRKNVRCVGSGGHFAWSSRQWVASGVPQLTCRRERTGGRRQRLAGHNVECGLCSRRMVVEKRKSMSQIHAWLRICSSGILRPYSHPNCTRKG